MNNVIKYTNEGAVFIINPSPFCGLTIEEIAEKDVPSGCAWEIINFNDLPVTELTPEEIRALMPRKSMVEFRVALRSIKVVQREGETELDGIYEAAILEKINLIADRELQAEARDYFLYAGYIDRSNPWVDILGAMFGLSLEQIDTFWLA